MSVTQLSQSTIDIGQPKLRLFAKMGSFFAILLFGDLQSIYRALSNIPNWQELVPRLYHSHRLNLQCGIFALCHPRIMFDGMRLLF